MVSASERGNEFNSPKISRSSWLKLISAGSVGAVSFLGSLAASRFEAA